MCVAKRGVGHEQRLLVADPAREASGPIARNLLPRARAAARPGSKRGGSGSGVMAWPGGLATPGKPLTVISAAYVRSRIARFCRTGNRNSSGVSSMNRVVQLPARKSGSRAG